MLELNIKWFIVLAVNFLVLLYLLNVILFKPLLKLFEEREENTKGAFEIAQDMTKKKDDAIAALNKELAGARDKASSSFEAMKTEGVNIQKEMFSRAEAEASDLLEKARTELRAETEKAKAKLRADVDKFSDEIVRKLIKV